MLTIRQIYQEDYPGGKKVSYQYSSEKYYEVGVERKDDGWNICMTEKKFEVPFVKKTIEEIFEPYKEGSEFYVAELSGEEVAVMVIQKLEWNNTLLIHDLYVEERFKGEGIGKRFIVLAKKRARELGVRSIVLETQTSNFSAIQFYLSNGFEVVGLHTISYSNEDVQNKEVRMEMAYIIRV